jgi:hypothetical protein
MRDQLYQFGFNSTLGEGGAMEFVSLDGFLALGSPLFSLEESIKEHILEEIHSGLGLVASRRNFPSIVEVNSCSIAWVHLQYNLA